MSDKGIELMLKSFNGVQIPCFLGSHLNLQVPLVVWSDSISCKWFEHKHGHDKVYIFPKYNNIDLPRFTAQHMTKIPELFLVVLDCVSVRNRKGQLQGFIYILRMRC